MEKLVKVSDIFNIQYGVTFELFNLTQCKSTHYNAIPFVSRTEKNNGVSAFVEKLLDVEPNPAHTLSVAVGGSVLSTFYQPKPYYSGFHIFVLVPKIKLSIIEMLFFAKCISANKYKYNYGRQANRTLKDILIPSKAPKGLLTKLTQQKVAIEEKLDSTPILKSKLNLNPTLWQDFKISDIFQVNYGVNLELNKMFITEKGIPFVSRTSNNNGVSAYVEEVDDILPNPANTISVSGGGSVLECFLQEKEYYSGRDLYYLKPKFKANKYHLLFITTIIKLEKYRFNYGRQANKTLKHLLIKLPVDKKNNPDFDSMEKYIKALPYSASL